jgi:DNA-binding transcriptional LysR family regulator
MQTMLAITLEQARTLDALATHGTLVKAAAALRKRHSAVLYALRNLEAQTGLALLDRSAYRTAFTPAGERVLVECRRLLAVEHDLETVCETIRSGWEPSLRVVFDGVVPASDVLAPVRALMQQKAPTRVEVVGEFLSRVEELFASSGADLMISVLPPHDRNLVGTALAPLRALLVAHLRHPLAKITRVQPRDLSQHTLITVRGSDPRLQLPTDATAGNETVQLHDFSSKKSALLAGLGYGWMPEALIARELGRGTLRKIAWASGNTHVFRPHVYHRRGREPGRATRMFIDALVSARRR